MIDQILFYAKYGFIAVLVLTSLLLIFNAFLKVRETKKKQIKSFNKKLLRIAHRPDVDNKPETIEEISRFEEVLSAISSQNSEICFEMAVPQDSDSIFFYISVPEEYVNSVKTQIKRVYVNSTIEDTDQYNIFTKDSKHIIAEVGLKKFYGLPINTYKKSGIDTFSPVMGALTDVKNENTGVTLQFVVQKSPSGVLKKLEAVLKSLENGMKLKHIVPQNIFDRIVGAFYTKPTNKDESPSTDPKDSKNSELIKEKTEKEIYSVNMRIAVAARDKKSVKFIFDLIKERYSTLTHSGHNELVFKIKDNKSTQQNFLFRMFNLSSAMFINSTELASLFHLVDTNIELQQVHKLKSKKIAVTTSVGKEGIVLGDNLYNGQVTKIHMSEADRLRHIYTIGQTGTGKTSFLKSLAYQDITTGKGMCVIDPHGDFIDDLLANIPKDRVNDVVLFDPGDLNLVLGLNMLEYERDKPEQKTFIVNEILSIFYKLFDKETMGPVFEQYMRNSLLLLMEGMVDKNPTLLDVPSVLTDEEFRNKLLENCHNKPVIDFWQKEVARTKGEMSLNEIAPYITSKFSNFIANDYVRPIIEQRVSSFNVKDIMNDGKILFVKLSKGKIGELNANLLGMIITGKVALGAFSREGIEESERRDFYLYIDEFQNFTTDSISLILSEARKYHLSLNVAHQYMAQLTDDIRSAVLGNVGTIISFRVGVEDAEILEKKFTPGFTRQDLTELENLHCVASILSNNQPIDPFSMKIIFAPRGSKEIAAAVSVFSKERFKA